MRKRHAFSLVELIVVMGLISVLISLLIPVTMKVRAASQATACMSNLRQMGNAWMMYANENNDYLLPYLSMPSSPEVAWGSYWLGVLDRYQVRASALLCPSATDTIDDPDNRGFGSASHAWTGKYSAPGSAVKLTPTQYRDGSYGYNRYMTAGNGQGFDGKASKVSAVRCMSEVPLLMDCTFVDVRPPPIGAGSLKAAPPPDLHNGGKLGDPEHWKILISRHAKGINVCMSDGSVRRVRLDSLYMMKWRTGWSEYRLDLPSF
jgi:prepilin-type N-terminal cleavage/methylation domain-containing protein/prepilin-type processing-associated H-X9-DG protein